MQVQSTGLTICSHTELTLVKVSYKVHFALHPFNTSAGSRNAVESLNMSLRKITKMRASFPSEQAALKLLYLALRNVSAKWEHTQHWGAALNQFTLLWEDRIRAARS